MKKTPRTKSTKGNLKIYDFFQKQATKVQISEAGHSKSLSTDKQSDSQTANDTKSSIPKTLSSDQPIIIDSDSEDFEFASKPRIAGCENCDKSKGFSSQRVPNRASEPSVTNDEWDNNLILKHSPDTNGKCTKLLKKRKIQSPRINESPKSKKFQTIHDHSETDATSCSSILQNNVQCRISVKTPEKLFHNLSDTQNKSNSPQTPLKNCDMNTLSSFKRKTKKTPSPKPKLFEKSPRKLEEFNVQIIDNFVRITPSKSNRKINDFPSPGTSVKKQIFSPPPTQSSAEAKKLNETTPKRERLSNTVCTPKHSKAKAKLDFSDDALKKSDDVTASEKKQIEIVHESLANLHIDFDENWGENSSSQSDEFNLNLDQSEHCKILESIQSRVHITIKVQSLSSEAKAICYLEGFWMHTALKVGDVIHLNAVKHPDGNWFINNEVGLLVLEPDLLISSTAVVNSLFCMRRSVLSERYHGFEPPNRIMAVGVFVHLLLQNILKANVQTNIELNIESNIEDLLYSDLAIKKMYEASLSIEDVKQELLSFVPKISNFIKQYVRKDSSNVKPDSSNPAIERWIGKIDSIDDIEENIWCPQLGVKGKVDLSIVSQHKILPLELKTGRASMSLEHKGQVLLYIMMMNKLGHKISSGLLLYLREGLLTEIKLTPQESRDIIILRNELAYYLANQPSNKHFDDNTDEKTLVNELPEPIDHLKGCRNCPYNVICAAHIKYESHNLSGKKNFATVQKEVTSHLEKKHLDYFIKWSYLLLLENVSHVDKKPLREIYSVPTEERTKKGRCIDNIVLDKVEVKSDSIIEHTFHKSKETCLVNFLASGIMENNYIVISTEKRPAIATGFVTHISIDSVTISLDKNLNEKYTDVLFHLDTYDSLANASFNLTSLTLLLEDSPRGDHLRKIIINKEHPTFLPKLPRIVATKSLPILKRLNKVQQRAVLKAVAAKDFLLIKGMPGTGKTATIVALIQLLVEINKSVLITSHTHSAVDNVCIRLQKFGVDVLRLGAISKVNEKLKLRSEYTLTKECKTPKDIEDIYNSAQVIAVTCLGSGHPLLSKRTVDVCIVDESTQVLQASVLRPLHCAKTFILIGDPDQLPPIIKNREAIKKGMSESLFERLCNEESCVTLDKNYRMNKTITALANAVTYKGELLIGNEAVANSQLSIPNEAFFKSEFEKDIWILQSLDNSLDASVQILDTNLNDQIISKFQNNCDISRCTNIFEVAVLIKLVNVLLQSGVCPESIGVIATYSAQVMCISKYLQSVDVSTVDQFQGKDKSVIFYSCTKYKSSRSPTQEYQLLDDQRRLTVAITRAKHKLVIVGDVKIVREYVPFCKMFESLDKRRFLLLEEGKLGFSWDSLLNECYPNLHVESNF